MKTKPKKNQAARDPLAAIPLSLLRTTLLKNAGVTHDQLAEKVAAKFGGPRLSRTTIGAVLAGTFRNEDVIQVFCEITGTNRETMFPEVEKNAVAS